MNKIKKHQQLDPFKLIITRMQLEYVKITMY